MDKSFNIDELASMFLSEEANNNVPDNQVINIFTELEDTLIDVIGDKNKFDDLFNKAFDTATGCYEIGYVDGFKRGIDVFKAMLRI